MAKVIYMRSKQRIFYECDDGSVIDFECRNDFFPISHGQPHEALPDGEYVVHADEPPAENNEAYGTFYISTGDFRDRDIHGGGSDLTDPFAARQGWEPTYGCLRMQNEDGKALSRLIIADGNDVQMVVME